MLASQIRQKAREALAGKWGMAAVLTLCYVVIVFAIEWAAGFISDLIPFLSALISIALAVINVPIAFGFTAVFIKLKRGEEVGYTEFLSIAFANIGNAWKVAGNIALKMLPFIIIFIICMALTMGVGVGSIIFEAATETINSSSSSIIGSGPSSNISTSASSTVRLFTILATIANIACTILLIVKSFYYVLSNFILFDNPNMTGKQIVEESKRLMTGNRWKYFCLCLSFIGWAFVALFTLSIGYFWLIPYMNIAIICFYDTLKGNTTTTFEENNVNPIQG